MAETIDRADLQDCDILLYRGTSWVARAIRLFDAADVNHAGLYLSPGDVAEAIHSGVVRRRLAVSRRNQEAILCARLERRPDSMQPVRRRAEGIVNEGHRYAYEQILLLAFLCLVRRLPLAAGLREFVRSLLDTAAAWLARIASLGREPMICSEFVYRCFDEAVSTKPNRFALHVLSVRGRGGLRLASRPAIDPKSLLARALATRPLTASVGNRPAKRSTPANPRTLQHQFERYEKALRSTRRSRRSLPQDAELEAALRRFAATWRATAGVHATQRADRKRRSHRVAAATTAVAFLAKTAADFVTPEDLRRSSSLESAGWLVPPGPLGRSTRGG